jgi:inner membrane protein
MLVKSHVPVAVASWTLIAQMLHVSLLGTVMMVPVAAFGGTLPDIDHPNSWLGRKVPGVSHLVRLCLGHRGGTHSLLAVVACVFGLFAALQSQRVGIGPVSPMVAAGITSLMVGYISHLLADATTKSGIPVLWPYRRTFRSPIAFTTGSWVEPIVAWSFVAGVAWHVGHLGTLAQLVATR